jgi:hypothetical protein
MKESYRQNAIAVNFFRARAVETDAAIKELFSAFESIKARRSLLSALIQSRYRPAITAKDEVCSSVYVSVMHESSCGESSCGLSSSGWFSSL